MSEAGGVDWIPALVVLAAGLVLGTGLLWRAFAAARRTVAAAPAAPVEIRDLLGKRDALLRQLRELDDTASKRTPAQLARERYGLELEAAHVLLELGERGDSDQASAGHAPAASSPASSSPGPASAERAGLRGFLWGVGSATSLLLLGLFVYQSAKPRPEGGSVTGEVPMAGAGSGMRPGSQGGAAGNGGLPAADEAALRGALEKNPNDLAAHLGLARVYLARQDMMGVWNETKLVLEKAPGNPQALAYQALVRMTMGQTEVALELLKQALAKDPDLVDGYVHMALVYVRLGRLKEAEATIALAAKRFPDRAAALTKLLADLEQPEPAAAEAEAPAGADPHAGLGPPGQGAPRPAATRGISGSVDLDPALKGTLAQGGVLFVFVREAGFGAGPPIAAKRLPATSFPVRFEIGEADAMLGQPFPESLLVEARLDSDGDPATRPPTDPRARLDDVKAGRSDLKLLLKRP